MAKSKSEFYLCGGECRQGSLWFYWWQQDSVLWYLRKERTQGDSWSFPAAVILSASVNAPQWAWVSSSSLGSEDFGLVCLWWISFLSPEWAMQDFLVQWNHSCPSCDWLSDLGRIMVPKHWLAIVVLSYCLMPVKMKHVDTHVCMHRKSGL